MASYPSSTQSSKSTEWVSRQKALQEIRSQLQPYSTSVNGTLPPTSASSSSSSVVSYAATNGGPVPPPPPPPPPHHPHYKNHHPQYKSHYNQQTQSAIHNQFNNETRERIQEWVGERQKVLSSASSTCSSHSSLSATGLGQVGIPVASSILKSGPVQALTARQAKTQSPIIMQSVKSTQVQKPILQTAIAPSVCVPASSTPLLLANASTGANKGTSQLSTSSSSSSLNTANNSCQNGQNGPELSSSHHAQGHSSRSPLPSQYLQLSRHMLTNGLNGLFLDPRSTPSSVQSASILSLNGPPGPSSSSVLSGVSSVSSSNPGFGFAPSPQPYPPSKIQMNTRKLVSPHVAHQSPQTAQMDRLLVAPPPPPPPPYTAPMGSLAACANADSHSSSASEYSTGHIPVNTVDPPSYTSSIIALAQQRINNMGPGGVAGPPPSRPPPAPPTANSDLVNTVESICLAQVNALHSSAPSPNRSSLGMGIMLRERAGPPLPPKPGFLAGNMPPSHGAMSDLSSVISNSDTDVSSSVNSVASHNQILQMSHNQYQLMTSSHQIVQQISSHSQPPPPPPCMLGGGGGAPRRPPPAPPTANMAPPPPPRPTNPKPFKPKADNSTDCVNGLSSCASPSPSTASSSTSATSSKKITTHQSPIPIRKKTKELMTTRRSEPVVKPCPPAAFKFFMEQHVENIVMRYYERENRRIQFEREMDKNEMYGEARENIRKLLIQKESNYIRLRRAKLNIDMFFKVRTIGVGAFGEVALVRKIDANPPMVFALKTLRKSDVLKRNQVAHVKAERDILSEADNEWVVKLYYSFQDDKNLYFVMEYIPGGDLMTRLIQCGIFDVNLARFYTAEIVLAVESVHKMGFIHRDIKPDNILIDKNGHIKLTDFGLCTGFRWTHNSKYYQSRDGHAQQDSMDVTDWEWPHGSGVDMNSHSNCHCDLSKPLERRRRRAHQRCLAHSLVGTPNYIAPEVLLRMGYSQLCDWWSVGVILYEMVAGCPPFYAKSPEETQKKVINWKQTLSFPTPEQGIIVSSDAKDLILKLCTDASDRLGRHGADEIKAHSFFRDLDFHNLRKIKAPHVPELLGGEEDTSNFDDYGDMPHNNNSGITSNGTAVGPNGDLNGYLNAGIDSKNKQHPDHAFFEFTFRRFFDERGQAYSLRTNIELNANHTYGVKGAASLSHPPSVGSRHHSGSAKSNGSGASAGANGNGPNATSVSHEQQSKKEASVQQPISAVYV